MVKLGSISELATAAAIGGVVYLVARGTSVKVLGKDIITIGGTNPSPNPPNNAPTPQPSAPPVIQAPSPTAGAPTWGNPVPSFDWAWNNVPFFNPFWGFAKIGQLRDVFSWGGSS
jgi:hypothetical protein